MRKSGKGLGIFLLLAGIVFLLHEIGAFNYIETKFNISLWGLIWSIVAGIFNLWPVLLIIIGINIIFRSRILERILGIGFMVLVIISVIYGPFYYFGVPWITNITNWDSVTHQVSTGQDNYSYSNKIDYGPNMTKGKSTIDLGACDLEITSGNNTAAEMQSNIRGIYASFGQSNGKLNMDVSEENIISGMDPNITRKANVVLGEKISWEIQVTTGASRSRMELKNLDVSSLSIELGAGDAEIHLGDKDKNVAVEIKGGVSNVKIYVPENAGVMVTTDNGLSANNFDALGLVKTGENQFTSKGFNIAENKFTVTLSTGISNINIFREK